MLARKSRSSGGFTLFEIMFVMLLSAGMLGFVTFNYRGVQNHLRYSANELVGLMKHARSKALSGTKYYSVYPVTASKIQLGSGATCNVADHTAETSTVLNLPTDVFLTNITWRICYTPRGVADESAEIVLRSYEEGLKTVEVVVGGAVRIK